MAGRIHIPHPHKSVLDPPRGPGSRTRTPRAHLHVDGAKLRPPDHLRDGPRALRLRVPGVGAPPLREVHEHNLREGHEDGLVALRGLVHVAAHRDDAAGAGGHPVRLDSLDAPGHVPRPHVADVLPREDGGGSGHNVGLAAVPLVVPALPPRAHEALRQRKGRGVPHGAPMC